MLESFAPFFPLLVATIAVTGVSVAGLFISKKLGLAPAQVRYVDTLEGMNEVLQQKVTFLEGENKDIKLRLDLIEERLKEALETNAELKQENFELRQQLAVRHQRRTSKTSGTPQ